MKRTKLYLLGMTTLALGQWSHAALANETPHSKGIEEIPDSELGDMRGRYTVDNHTVAWFGVKMISTWQTGAGEQLQSTLALSMDMRNSVDAPKVTFIPTVTITQPDIAVPQTINGPSRSIDSSGLANANGVQQSVQVAGNGNVASNVTDLKVTDLDSATADQTDTTAATPDAAAASSKTSTTAAVANPAINTPATAVSTPPSVETSASTPHVTAGPALTTTSSSNLAAAANAPSAPSPAASHTDLIPSQIATAYANGSSATASFDGESARVLLTIEGQGAVEQWIRNGSVGQSVQLQSDNQLVSNRMEISLVRQAVAGNTQLAQNVAQAISLARGIGLQ